VIIKPFNAELNPIRHLPALLEVRHIFHVSRIRVNKDENVILEQTQDITDNTQSESVDKIVETCRISTRKKPSIRGNVFYGK